MNQPDQELPITEEIPTEGPPPTPGDVALRDRFRKEIAENPGELRALLEDVLTEERTDIAISYLTGWLRIPLLGASVAAALDQLLPERLIDAICWAVERRRGRQ